MTTIAEKTGLQKKYALAIDWLVSDSPESALQAWLGQLYVGVRTFQKNVLGMTGLTIVLFLILVALFAPILAPYSFDAQDLTQRLQPPSFENWLGTDEFGRDIFSRILYGSTYTLQFVSLVIFAIAPLGLLIGVTAAYAGGVVDHVLMRITDIFLSFPRLILALAFVATLGPGLGNAMIAIVLTAWPPYARVARAEALRIRNSDFILAVKIAGASPKRIILRHIVPLCVPTIIVRGSLDMGSIILTAASLGFLGLGAQPPQPEWGAMISAGRQYFLEQWWISTIPGIAICFSTIGFNLLGDGLRDVMDPKYR